ncbi:unnamed protein product [Amoebophrya sp. A120]|nr:unnamed protein product [Amoebophrya sp. A120]|eukprot:GSA120T00002269001.1
MASSPQGATPGCSPGLAMHTPNDRGSKSYKSTFGSAQHEFYSPAPAQLLGASSERKPDGEELSQGLEAGTSGGALKIAARMTLSSDSRADHKPPPRRVSIRSTPDSSPSRRAFSASNSGEKKKVRGTPHPVKQERGPEGVGVGKVSQMIHRINSQERLKAAGGARTTQHSSALQHPSFPSSSAAAANTGFDAETSSRGAKGPVVFRMNSDGSDENHQAFTTISHKSSSPDVEMQDAAACHEDARKDSAIALSERVKSMWSKVRKVKDQHRASRDSAPSVSVATSSKGAATTGITRPHNGEGTNSLAAADRRPVVQAGSTAAAKDAIGPAAPGGAAPGPASAASTFSAGAPLFPSASTATTRMCLEKTIGGSSDSSSGSSTKNPGALDRDTSTSSPKYNGKTSAQLPQHRDTAATAGQTNLVYSSPLDDELPFVEATARSHAKDDAARAGGPGAPVQSSQVCRQSAPSGVAKLAKRAKNYVPQHLNSSRDVLRLNASVDYDHSKQGGQTVRKSSGKHVNPPPHQGPSSASAPKISHGGSSKLVPRVATASTRSTGGGTRSSSSATASSSNTEQAYKFKARPPPPSTYQISFPSRVQTPKRDVVQPDPFSLKTDQRGERHREKIDKLREDLQRKQEEEIALANGFKARDIGHYADLGMRHSVDRRPNTEPKPFRLSSRQNTPRRSASPDPSKGKFRALPLPQTTFEPEQLPPRRRSFVATKPVSPRLSLGSKARGESANRNEAEDAGGTGPKFKAMPMPDFDRVKFEVRPAEFELTEVQEPRLATEHRAQKHHAKFEEVKQAILEERERDLYVPFVARPVADYSNQFVNRSVERRPVTEPEPFKLTEQTRRTSGVHSAASSVDSTAPEAAFRARNLPQTTYEPSQPPEKPKVSPTKPKPFRLSTNDDTHTLKRFLVKKEQEDKAKRNVTEPYKANPVPDFSEPWRPDLSSTEQRRTSVVDKVQEFRLSTSNFSRKPEPQKFDTKFKAKPIQYEELRSKWLAPAIEPRPITDPVPFKGLEESQRRRSSTPRRRSHMDDSPQPFKARPVPDSVLHPKPPTINHVEQNRRRTLPMEVKLHSDRQAVKREDYEREKKERMAERAEQKAEELRARADAERAELERHRKQLQFRARPVPQYRSNLPVVQKPPLTEPRDTRLYQLPKRLTSAGAEDSTRRDDSLPPRKGSGEAGVPGVARRTVVRSRSRGGTSSHDPSPLEGAASEQLQQQGDSASGSSAVAQELQEVAVAAGGGSSSSNSNSSSSGTTGGLVLGNASGVLDPPRARPAFGTTLNSRLPRGPKNHTTNTSFERNKPPEPTGAGEPQAKRVFDPSRLSGASRRSDRTPRTNFGAPLSHRAQEQLGSINKVRTSSGAINKPPPATAERGRSNSFGNKENENPLFQPVLPQARISGENQHLNKDIAADTPRLLNEHHSDGKFRRNMMGSAGRATKYQRKETVFTPPKVDTKINKPPESCALQGRAEASAAVPGALSQVGAEVSLNGSSIFEQNNHHNEPSGDIPLIRRPPGDEPYDLLAAGREEPRMETPEEGATPIGGEA